MILESKAVAPPIATLGLVTIVGAGYATLREFGLLVLTAEQETAIAGLGLALLPFLNLALAYLLPHTPRPDRPVAVAGGNHSPAPAEPVAGE